MLCCRLLYCITEHDIAVLLLCAVPRPGSSLLWGVLVGGIAGREWNSYGWGREFLVLVEALVGIILDAGCGWMAWVGIAVLCLSCRAVEVV